MQKYTKFKQKRTILVEIMHEKCDMVYESCCKVDFEFVNVIGLRMLVLSKLLESQTYDRIKKARRRACNIGAGDENRTHD